MKRLYTLVTALLFYAVVLKAQSPIFHLKYDESDGVPTVREEISQASIAIANQFNKPERVKGIEGNALRTDGFSTWIQRDVNLNITTSLSLDTWISIESYPADEEVPVANLTPSAIISQLAGNNGFALRMNTFGQWWFEVYINGQRFTCNAPAAFPKYSWAHVAAVVDGSAGEIRLYLNGSLIGTTTTPVNGTINKASVPLMIGKANTNKMLGIFLVNAMNAAYDNTRIFNSPLAPSFISSAHSSGVATATTTGEDAIAVSSIRFQNDLQRPGYHAMPPANWTNEPHGLAYHNGTYHMFYQRTPNGPFKTQMNWGHMTSSDLVHWVNTRDALWPQLNLSPTNGYDMKGIWSGDVVVHNGIAHAFYTCVNHSGPYNPGIAHATSSDAGFRDWKKLGPVIDKQFVNDFRDPYLFKVGTLWYMIIGAAYSGYGGLDCYTSADLNTWTHKSDFTTVSYSEMDIGSAIWEMPVFEPIGGGKYILIVNPIGGTVGKYGPKYTRGVYWTGTFVNGRFTPDYRQPKMLDVIHGHLSPTVERNTSGQLVGIGMVDERRNSEAQLQAGWCHVFSLPRVYSLLPDNQTLGQAPAPELASLRVAGTQEVFTNRSVNGATLLTTPSSAKVEIIATIPSTSATKYGLNLRVSPDRQEITKLYYDATMKKVVLDKSQSTTSPTDEERVVLSGDYDETAFGKPTTFHVYLDNSIIDVFINEKAAFSARIYPTRNDSRGIELYAEGTGTFSSVEIWGSSTSVVPTTGVVVNKASTTISSGNTEQLVATVLPASATNRDVVWSSSDTSIATVSSSGVVTGLAAGTATITVRTSSGNFEGTCTINVVPAPSYQVYDFESGNLNGWTTSGLAFSSLDVSNAGTYWGGPFNHQGTYHMWGFNDGGDSQTGEMRTSDFVLGGDGKVLALISGGSDIDRLNLGIYRASDNLFITGITGVNDEAYVERVLDAGAFIGTRCYLKAVDNVTGGWGHINLDNIRIPIQSTAIAVTGVALNKSATTLNVGATETLVATVAPANATNKNVQWASSNAAVATVSATGVVTAVGQGSAMITVTTTDGTKTATCAVTIASQLYYVLDFENGNLNDWTVLSGNAFSPSDVCTDVNWGWGGPFNHQGSWHLWGFKDGGDTQTGEMRSQNFTLSGNGQVTALVGGGSDLNNLYVALCRTSDNLVIARQTGQNNEAYATVALNGSGFAGTQCYIKVVDTSTGGFGHINVDDIRIPVTAVPAPIVPVTGVSLNKTSTSLFNGSSETLIATVSPSNATNKTVSWKTSNPAVASINSTGRVTAVGAGSAIITVTTDSGAKIATCSLTVTQQYMVLDFETGNLNGWTVFSGNAFSALDVCTDVNWGWGGPFAQQGSWHLWGFKDGGDVLVGELRSQNFTLGGNGQVSTMVGGGADVANLHVALVRASDHTVISRQTGENNEAYATKTLDGSGYIGTLCYVRIYDNSTGGFGHINVDNVRIPVQTTSSASGDELTKVQRNEGQDPEVFPNPATDEFFVDLRSNEGPIRMTVMDLNGKSKYETTLSGGMVHNISTGENGLHAGMYVVRMTSSGGTVTVKLIVR
jgi:fructan beta-fructosidase